MKRKPRPDVAARNRAAATPLDDLFSPEPNSGCSLWLGPTNASGYGIVGRSGGRWLAHRLIWTIERGPIPSGAQVLHRCDTRCCVNPDHLFLGDNAANIADRMSKGRLSGVRGEAHSSARLTEDQVRAIRADPRNNCAIAQDYGVSNVAISALKRGKTWRHVR